jgi:predicted Zn finger-like uncharacterized protein
MFTVCPKCSLKLVVTAADLRVAQGYVRCGRCSNVFNALAGLSDEQQAAALAQQAARPAARAPQGEPEPIATEPMKALDDEPIPDAALEFDLASTDVSKVFIVPDPDDQSPTGTFESIVLETPEPSPPSEVKAAETLPIEFELDEFVTQADPPPASGTAPAIASVNVPAPAASSGTAVAPSPAAGARDVVATPRRPRPQAPPPAAPESAAAPVRTRVAPPAAPAIPRAPAPRRPMPPRAPAGPVRIPAPRAPEVDTSPQPHTGAWLTAWRAGSAVLALLLLVQLVHHYRTDLAGIGWLRSLYGALGMPITPHWDLNAYEVHQLGASAGPQSPGELTVRASVKNTGEKQQPLPLLRITVQDRFGNRVAARDVAPSAYLAAASAAHSYMESGQRVDAEIAFVDPGPSAVGFEIDACLADAAGHIACANDASNH